MFSVVSSAFWVGQEWGQELTMAPAQGQGVAGPESAVLQAGSPALTPQAHSPRADVPGWLAEGIPPLPAQPASAGAGMAR